MPLGIVPGAADPAATVDPAEAGALADELLADAARLQSRIETRRAKRLARLAAAPESMEFLLTLTDQVARISDPRRALRRLSELVDEGGSPAALGPLDSALLSAGLIAGRVAPAAVADLVRRRLRLETSGVVLSADERRLRRRLARRRRQGFAVNVNLLGEAILGDDEAARRLDRLVATIGRPDVDYVSVKASAVCARLSSVAFERSVARVADALTVLFRAAGAADPAVFVNLDMEEYRDLDLTLDAFRLALSRPGLAGLDAGIVLQAYLPDSHRALEELATGAVDRHRTAGGRTKVRIVKGANLAMERVEAELQGWVPAPFATKMEVDESYKRLLARALDPGWGGALRVGLASHNLFDVAWGLLLAQRCGTVDRLEVEMLEGMAPGQAEAVRRRGVAVRLYAPVVAPDEFDSAVAYLVRRLDENSAADNYLRNLLSDEPGALGTERGRFVDSVLGADRLDVRPRRDQNRAMENVAVMPTAPFTNQPDTDWAKPANRRWMTEALSRWQTPPLVVCGVAGAGDVSPPLAESGVSEAGDASPSGRVMVTSEDPSRPGSPSYRYEVGDTTLVDAAVAAARSASWGSLPAGERAERLAGAAGRLAAHRGELIAAMVVDAGKVVAEADVEVSEAIDYAAYYAGQALALDERSAAWRPLGTVVVAPPWNFPLAIPLGGALAALAAGNAVIMKPAPETVLTASIGARCLWEAGIPRAALQFLPCRDDEAGRRLITHPDVDAVVLTGSLETATMFLEWRPDLRLLAETSGKNAIIVTAAADLDVAVADLVRSAFGHAGQKCSAASLAIVERSVLEDGRFLRKLADATRTLVVGAAADPATEVGPLIHPPSPVLARALTELDPGEAWLVRPVPVGDDAQLWSPGIKTGVQAGSWFHRTECFGPVLGIMAADDLDAALELQNTTGFGLTAGLESLDPREIRRWLDGAEAGNLYVNRAITGAIVRRQPFGGWKRSSVGPTAKAGGPGYVPALCQWTDTAPDRLAAARTSYPVVWDRLRAGEDPTVLEAEIDLLRHRPLPEVVLRVELDADPVDVELCLLAASTVGAPVRTSLGDDDLAGALARSARLRILGTASVATRRTAHRAGSTIDERRPVADGEVELPRWTREQAVSITAHRYGRPIRRPALGL